MGWGTAPQCALQWSVRRVSYKRFNAVCINDKLDRYPYLHGYLNELCDMLFHRDSTCQFDAIHEYSIQLGLFHTLNEALYTLTGRSEDFSSALNQTPFGLLISSLSQSEGKLKRHQSLI